ncbi:hypothetical protein Ciccas_002086 [Cichlidogyrus casuarinus]|uniref:Calponin-homology (CH) domain-containing protein n=1 Tax=Cichlidogyrus casuarinus TaxID=1844966 RepID=A0ABD2QIA5_9PLAT
MGVCIRDLKDSWQDGLGICALVHHFYPQAYRMTTVTSLGRVARFELAFASANTLAGIQQLFTSDDLMAPDCEELWALYLELFVRRFYENARNHYEDTTELISMLDFAERQHRWQENQNSVLAYQSTLPRPQSSRSGRARSTTSNDSAVVLQKSIDEISRTSNAKP